MVRLAKSSDENNPGNSLGGVFYGASAGGGQGLGAGVFLFDTLPFFTGDTILQCMLMPNRPTENRVSIKEHREASAELLELMAYVLGYRVMEYVTFISSIPTASSSALDK